MLAFSRRLGTLTALTSLLALFAVHAVWPFGSSSVDVFFGKWINSAVCVLPGLYIVANALRRRRERLPWFVLGLAATLWGVGNTYFLVAFFDADTIPIPSLADGFWIGFYLTAYAGLVLLMRSRIADWRWSTWLDGLIGATATASVATAIVFHEVLASVGGSTLAVATNLSYPLADVVLMGFVILVLTSSGWRPGITWAFIAGGLAVFTVTDSIYLFQSAEGTYVAGKLLDVGWPLGLLLLAYASSARSSHAATRVGATALLMPPLVFCAAAIAVLEYDHAHRLTLLSVVLAGACLVAVAARMSAAFVENLGMLAASRREARTDALTGLGNRRRLLADLTEHLRDDRAAPTLLAMFDLNGFKSYNDAYGHGAGDALLRRLGEKLAVASRGIGTAYRMGGDEFCALVRLDGLSAGIVASTLGSALTERGEGFSVTASTGAVTLPHDANDPESALRLADQRMYAQKGAGRATEGQQAANALVFALTERSPDLREHLDDVAHLAERTAVALGLEGAELHNVRRAAELHDIGKIAIPDSILSKPGPLDEREWEFIRRHTLVGEKILLAAPALRGAAELVRSSHERVDGNGYPDALAGDAIPLGARIIAVCDAYGAMTRNRAYRRAQSKAQALEELHRCAGSQFDADVVAAFTAVVEGLRPLRLAS